MSTDSLETLAAALDAQTRRADGMAGKLHERGLRIAALEKEVADLRATVVVSRTDLRLVKRDMEEITEIAARCAHLEVL